MFGLQTRTKQANCLSLLKGEDNEPGLFTRVKAKKLAREKSPEEVAALLQNKGMASENNTMHQGWAVSWRAMRNHRGGGIDQAIDLCGNRVTCPSHVFFVTSVTCPSHCFLFVFVLVHFSRVDNGRLCRSFAMFPAGRK